MQSGAPAQVRSEPAPLIAAKVCLPKLAFQAVVRPRANEVLDEGARHPITLLAAPPGSGKTTAVCVWALSRPAHWPVCWYSIDEHDDEPEVFLRYLREALRPVLAEDVNGFGDCVRARDGYGSVAHLIEALSRRTRPFSLVLDGIEALRSEATRSLAMLLLRYRPTAMRVVLTTSNWEWPDLAEWCSAGGVVEAGFDALAFDGEACSAYLQRAVGRHVSRSAVNELVRETCGWATGIALTAGSLTTGAAGVLAEGSVGAAIHDNWRIERFLRRRILETMEPHDLDFCQQLSILDIVTLDAAEAVAPHVGTRRRAQRLATSGAFLTSSDESGLRLQWLPCLRTLLLSDLAERLGAAEVTALHSRASAWYESQRDYPNAIRHALDASEGDTAIELASTYIEDIGARPEALLRAVGEHASGASLVRHPTLAAAIVAAHLAIGDHSRAGGVLAELDQIRTAQSEVGPEQELDVDVSTLRAAVACLGGSSASADDGAVRLLREAPTEGRFRPVLEYYVALATRATGQEGPPTARLQERAQAFRQSGDHNTYLYWEAMIGARYEAQGQLTAASQVYGEAAASLSDSGLTDHVLYAPLVLGSSAVQRQWWHPDEMNRLATSVRDRFLSEDPDDLCWLHAVRSCVLLARASAATGQFTDAEDYLGLADHRVSSRTWIVHLADEVTEARVVNWLLAGDDDSFARWAIASREGEGCGGSDALRATLHACECLGAAEPERALAAVAGVLNQASRDQAWGERLIRAMALRAVANWQLGRKEQAIDDLLHALTRAQAERQVRVFAEVHPDLGDVFEALANEPARLAGALSRQFFADALNVHHPDSHGTGVSVERSDPTVVDFSLAALTPREQQIYGLLASGLKLHRIAERLTISVNTVKTHQRRIYKKLNVHDIADIRASAGPRGRRARR